MKVKVDLDCYTQIFKKDGKKKFENIWDYLISLQIIHKINLFDLSERDTKYNWVSLSICKKKEALLLVIVTTCFPGTTNLKNKTKQKQQFIDFLKNKTQKLFKKFYVFPPQIVRKFLLNDTANL